MDTSTDRAVLGVRDMVHDWLLTHLHDASRCKDEIWVVAFFSSCTVEGFRQFSIMDECELLKSSITMSDKSLLPIAVSANWPFGGLYTECTTSPTSQSKLVQQFLLVFHKRYQLSGRPMRIALPYLLWGRSATSDISAILALERFVGLCVSWRHRQ